MIYVLNRLQFGTVKVKEYGVRLRKTATHGWLCLGEDMLVKILSHPVHGYLTLDSTRNALLPVACSYSDQQQRLFLVLNYEQLDCFKFLEDISPLIQEASSVLTHDLSFHFWLHTGLKLRLPEQNLDMWPSTPP